MTPLSIEHSIERATALSHRILQAETLLANARGYADSRWVDEKQSFMDTNAPPGKPHIVNTSTALTTIALFPEPFHPEKLKAYEGLILERICKFYASQYQTPDGSQGFWESKGTANWTPYVGALALGAISQSALRNSVDQRQHALQEVRSISGILEDQTRYLSEFVQQWSTHQLPSHLIDYDHLFFAYTALEALGAAYDAWLPPITGGIQRWNALRDAALQRMTLDFYSQMTFQLAGLNQHVDVITLTLAAYSIRKFTASDYSAIHVPDDVVHAAIDTIVSLQNKAGTWDTTTPLLGAATGRVGCSSVELALCLMRIPQADRFFEKLEPSFGGLLEFILRGFDPQDPLRGWGTDIRRNGSNRQTWYSFMVFSFLHLFLVRARQLAAALLLSTFRVTQSYRRPYWGELGDYENLKAALRDRLIEPWKSEAPIRNRSCAAILFGPPGTGKSSIAGALAGELKWPLVEIGPSDFLRDGVDGIFANGDRVFQRLLLLERVVVLFDEVDELVTEREADADKISKFLTTYMLPWLQRLRDRAALIFLFATNHIERFDAAIRRHGRFDFAIPIGPPQGSERVRVVRSILHRRNSIPESFYSALANDTIVPAQTTLGDILRIAGKLSDTALGEEARLREAFAPANLLIKELPETGKTEWTQFINFCKEYAS
jgi:hypothetical protein